MSDVVSDDELNALAAEYVLGTLDYEERKGAAALLEVEPAFRGIVRSWERRFGDLHLMVEAVEPDPQLWQRIKPKMGGVEQIPTAIPSHADEPSTPVAATPLAAAATVIPFVPAAATPPAPVATAAEPKVEAARPDVPVVADAPPAVAVAPVEFQPMELKPPESKPADANLADASPAGAELEDKPAETAPETKLAETKPAENEAEPAGAKLAEANPPEAKPAEAKPSAIVEAELKLAELAALLPVERGGTAPTEPEPATLAPATPAPDGPTPEEGLHTHAPDLVPRGFVPPAPMSTRGSPAVIERTVHKGGGGGWMAATLVMALIALALAGLISAWRFFPERLPPQLRANAVLNQTTQAQPALPKVAPKARPKPAPFDE